MALKGLWNCPHSIQKYTINFEAPECTITLWYLSEITYCDFKGFQAMKRHLASPCSWVQGSSNLRHLGRWKGSSGKSSHLTWPSLQHEPSLHQKAKGRESRKALLPNRQRTEKERVRAHPYQQEWGERKERGDLHRLAQNPPQLRKDIQERPPKDQLGCLQLGEISIIKDGWWNRMLPLGPKWQTCRYIYSKRNRLSNF